MSLGLAAQYVMNGAMLGMMYALVAVGFTLFFGVLDVIQFAHGDVVTAGAFAALAALALLGTAGVASPALLLAAACAAAIVSMAALGALIARALVLPLKSAPALNVLLVTLMAGTAARQADPLFHPQAAPPPLLPPPLPGGAP